jgi:hypothetical protein
LTFTVAVPQGVTLTAASQDWISVLTPEPANNGGSATIEITCTANTSGTDRFGLVTVEGSDGSQGQLVVCQYEPEDPPIVVSPATAQVAAAGQTGVAFTVNVLEGVIWTATVQTGGDWVTDLAETATSFTVNCAANTGAERTAEIVVTAGDYKALVAIVQAAGTPPIPPANAIQATPATRHILAAGGTASFSFTTTPADLAWTVSILWPPDVTADQMWLTLADDTTGIGSDSITVTAKPNETAATRRAGVKIADASGATYAVVEVEQFSLNEDKPVVVTPENAAIASEGGALSLDVETLPVAVNWTADIMWPEGTEDAAKWATITAGASGAGTGAISITVQPNTGDVERKIPVRVTDANSNVVMAVLTQAGKSQPVEGEVNDNNTSGGGGACVGLNTGSHRSGGNTAIYAILAGALVLDALLRRRKARNRR